MPPSTLAPLDAQKNRALTTIYAPRTRRSTRKNKTAGTRMLGSDLSIKPSLSPFYPLPAIGQKLQKESSTKVIVFDLKNKDLTQNEIFEKKSNLKFDHILKPLTPHKIHGYLNRTFDITSERVPQPQQLIRENTYEVLEPIYVNARKAIDDDDHTKTSTDDNNSVLSKSNEDLKVSPKTRFKRAAIKVARISTEPETGKLLCLREKLKQNYCPSDNSNSSKSECKLEELPQSPKEKLNKISEIFQCLDMQGRHRDRMKKENSWF